MQAAAAFGYNPGVVVPDPAATGGTRPDSTSENEARYLVSKLIAVDAALDQLDNLQGAQKVDEGTFDSVREDARLRRKGRMYVLRLAKLVDTEPRADVFATSGDYGDSPGGTFRAGAAFASSQGAHRVRRAY